MYLKSVVTAWLCFAFGHALVCPVAQCSGLRENLCARTEGGILYVNTNSCDSDTVCTITGIMQWWQSAHGGEYECTQYPAVYFNTTLLTNCGTEAADRNFQSGQGHVDCHTDQDCILQDSTVVTGSCQCTLRSNGLGLCVPDIGNSLFDDYWSDCNSDNLGDTDVLQFWSFYTSLWVYLQTDLPCSSYLAEVDTFTTLFINYQQSGAWSLFVSGWLLS